MNALAVARTRASGLLLRPSSSASQWFVYHSYYNAQNLSVTTTTTTTARRFLSVKPPPAASGGSSAREPAFKIQAHVLAFLIILLPVGIYGFWADRHKIDEEDLEEELRGRYGADIATQTRNNQAMKEFFRNTIQNPEAGVEDERLREVLHGGRGRNQKRFHEIDKNLLGTKEGQELAKKTQEELQQEAAMRKERRKQRRKKKKMAAKDEESAEENQQQRENAVMAKLKAIGENIDTKQVATVAVVGSVAAAAGFFLGGGRRN